MPRFDLYRRAGQPGYLLDVQSDHLDALPTRMVVPLLPPSPALPPLRDLNPPLVVEGETLAMMTISWPLCRARPSAARSAICWPRPMTSPARWTCC